MQLQLMEKLMQALSSSAKLVADVPKGTGCTTSVLAVLCSWCLDARKAALEVKKPLPKLVCIVRNPQAIPQLITAFSKIPFKVGVSLFGASRDQLCINPAISDSVRSQKDSRCQALQECNGCSYYTVYRKNLTKIRDVYSPRNMDIEDWKKEGSSEGFCPYYAARAVSQDSTVVIATLQQMLNEDVNRLSKLVQNGVVYIEDADLIPHLSLGTDLTPTKEYMETLKQEIKKMSDGSSKYKFSETDLRLLNEVSQNIQAMQDRLLKQPEVYNDYNSDRTTVLVRLVCGDATNSENSIKRMVLSTLSLLDAVQSSSDQVSSKNTYWQRHYFNGLEGLISRLVKVMDDDQTKGPTNIGNLLQGCHSTILTSEYLPEMKTEFCNQLGLYRSNFRDLLIWSASHTVSPLEHQLSVCVVPDIGKGAPALFDALQAELSRLRPEEQPSVEINKKILELGSWIGRILQTMPAGMITVFGSSLVMRYCHDIWQSTGILSQMDSIKKLCLTLQSCRKSQHEIDPIDGMVPEFLPQASAQYSALVSASRSSSSTFSRNQALKKYLELYAGAGAHLMISVEDLPFIEQSLPGDYATRTVLLLGSPQVDSRNHGLQSQLASYLARLVGRVLSHQYDHGIIAYVGSQQESEKCKQYLPKWLMQIMDNKSKSNSDSDEFLQRAKRFFEDVNRRNNSLKFEGDTKKGIGHPPTNGWALSQGLADSLRRLNTSTPSDTAALTRKFIPLNPERKQTYERLKQDALNPPAPTVSEQSIDPTELERPSTKVKLNDGSVAEIAPHSKYEPSHTQTGSDSVVNRTISMASLLGPAASTTGEDSTNAVTYIPNVASLRSASNTVTWSAIKTLLGPNQSVHLHLSCVICYERDRNFQVSKCGHVCCKDCWDIRLKELMECPVCKEKVRTKTLVTIV